MEETRELAALIMSDKDEIEVSAGDKGVSVKAKGGAATRIGHSFADLISPFTAIPGALGDEINYFRINRRETVEFALIEARKKRENLENEQQPVAPKLLSTWVEGVANEDLNEENIIELWSEILARSPTKFDSRYAVAMSIFRNIGAPEAELMSKLRSWFDPTHGYFQYHRISEENETRILDFLHGNKFQGVTDFMEKRIRIKLHRWEQSMPRLDVGLIETISLHSEKGTYRKFVTRKKTNVVNVLIYEGILERRELSASFHSNKISTTYLQVTDFGLSLLEIIFPDNHPVRQKPTLQEWGLIKND